MTSRSMCCHRGVDDEFGAEMVGDRPAHDPAGEHVEHDRCVGQRDQRFHRGQIDLLRDVVGRVFIGE